MHDVLGRALSAIALKSELGAELSRRGQGERAAEQMLEVRELANDSLREVRAVVAGYRQADLATEVAGARSVLRSAGVRTRVIGEDTTLPPQVQSALAWVVREGATNVVRHSSADTCTIDVAVVEEDGERLAQLTIVNDGVSGPPSTGSGLVGLSERLADLGGTVTTEASGATFTLRARVPLAGAAAALPGGTMEAP
ncbi:histidine kinase [Georgenia phoenicis]|uniref:sensor histidine kinase n=1 Tax=Georgenia sp. 1P07AB TaxID=554105 RepID=UPI0039B0AD87